MMHMELLLCPFMRCSKERDSFAHVAEELWSCMMTDGATGPAFSLLKTCIKFLTLKLNFCPQSCCYLLVHSSVMGKPLREGKEFSSCSNLLISFVHKDFLD